MELSRKIIILIYGRAFSFFLSLLIPLILTRLLLKEDYGSYQQLVMIYTIVQAILLFGMPQSLLYYFPRKEESEHPLLIRQTWTILLLSALFAMAIFWIGAEIMETSLPNHHLQPFIFLLGLYTGIMLLVMPIQNLLILEDKESLAMKSMIGFTIIDVVVLPIAAWYNPTTLGMVHGIIGTAISKLFIVLFYIYQNYLSKRNIGFSYYQDQLAYGIPVGLTAMIYVFNVNIDKYMVGMFFSSSVFAVYYLGSLWAPIFGWITQSASQVVIPRMSKAHKDTNLTAMRTLYKKSIEKLSIIFLPSTVLLAFIAKPLIVTLFTENYEDAVPIFTIYLLLLPTYALNLSWILMASGQTRFLLSLAVISSIINIILSYFLLMTLNGDNRLLGIPFATVTVTWFSTIIIMHRTMKTIESKVSEAYPWKKILKIISVSIISVVPIIGLLLLELPDIIFLFGSIIIYGLVFLIFSLKFNILEEAEIKLVNSFFQLKEKSNR